MTDSTRALIPQRRMFGGPSEPLVMQDLAAADPGAPATRDVTRLSEAAHTLCRLLSAFSTAAAAAASDLEEIAARGELDEARPLVGAGLILAGLLTLAGLREHGQQVAQRRLGRALALVTNSEVVPRRSGPCPCPGSTREAHGHYRGRPGVDLAVLTLSHLAPPPRG